MPGDVRKVEIFRLACVEMHFVLFCQSFGDFVHCAGTAVPAVAVDHGVGDFHGVLFLSFDGLHPRAECGCSHDIAESSGYATGWEYRTGLVRRFSETPRNTQKREKPPNTLPT